MKTAVVAIVVLAATLATGCMLLFREKKDDAPVALAWKPRGKVAVVFFSQSEVGNTRIVAEWIAEATGGELAEVAPLSPYPEPYGETLRVANAERADGTAPAIKPIAAAIDDCDTVFIGSPVWYGTFAAPVSTFLSDHSLAGKTVIPFCTHGGGGAGRTFEDIKAACPDSIVLPGFSARGSNQIERRIGVGVKRTTSKNDVVAWLNKLGE